MNLDSSWVTLLPKHQLFYPNSPHRECPLSFRTNPCAWYLCGTWHSIKMMWAVGNSWHPWISTPLGLHLTDNCIRIYGNRFVLFIIPFQHVLYLCCFQEGHICGQSMLSKPCIKWKKLTTDLWKYRLLTYSSHLQGMTIIVVLPYHKVDSTTIHWLWEVNVIKENQSEVRYTEFDMHRPWWSASSAITGRIINWSATCLGEFRPSHNQYSLEVGTSSERTPPPAGELYLSGYFWIIMNLLLLHQTANSLASRGNTQNR